MKIGFDVHGVLDTHRKMYASLIWALRSSGNEVYILTGCYDSQRYDTEADLQADGIRWDGWFSIPDYLARKGIEPTGTDKQGLPTFPSDEWDRAKATYCDVAEIDLMIDDSPSYGRYFNGKTVFLLQRDPEHGDKWDRMLFSNEDSITAQNAERTANIHRVPTTMDDDL